MSNKTECMIRLDDITPDMDMDRFQRVKDVLDKYQICPLMGVVPDNQDKTLHKEGKREDFWRMIRELQENGWKVAQHGTYHIYETEDSGLLGVNPFSEFAGLPYEKQLQKLQAGKQILEDNGIVTDIFMAPGHTYDNHTLRALAKCGFKVVTDGLYKKPYYEKEILFIPCRLRGFKKPNGVETICLHTNLMNEQEIEELDTFCKTHRDLMMNFEPDRYVGCAVRRNVIVRLAEKTTLLVRQLKNRIANSKRLAWYMEKTNHKSGKMKWLKRILCLPLLVFYKEKE